MKEINFKSFKIKDRNAHFGVMDTAEDQIKEEDSDESGDAKIYKEGTRKFSRGGVESEADISVEMEDYAFNKLNYRNKIRRKSCICSCCTGIYSTQKK